MFQMKLLEHDVPPPGFRLPEASRYLGVSPATVKKTVGEQKIRSVKLNRATPNRSESDIRATAYHEAGHCVAAILYGRTIRYVTIAPGKRKNRQGQVMVGRRLIRRVKVAPSAEQTKADVNAALIGCYAGGICESASTGRPVEPSSITDDHNAAVGMVSAFLGEDATPAILQDALVRLYQESQKLFMSPKACRAVRHIADALIVRRTLTGGEVKRLVLQAFDAEG